MQANHSTKSSTDSACDFCGSGLTSVYRSSDTQRGASVSVCNNCGLVQSIYSREKPAERVVSISSGAAWGNIRHGKGLRLKAALPILETVDWGGVTTILDVGSNRGDFVKWAREKNESVSIVGIEPDPNIIEDYKSTPGFTLHQKKLENSELKKDSFDFVYCSHTLEHAASASKMLEQMRDCMKPGAKLFLEVPNIESISDPNIIEDFFLDKHSFHFNRSVLLDYLKHLGFRIISGEGETDRYNIAFLVSKEKKSKTGPFKPSDSSLPEQNIRLITTYESTLNSNRAKLKSLVEKKINPFLARQRVVFWGGGRMFDALVRYGGLDPRKACCVVDEHLWKYVPKAHGVDIKRPEYIKVIQPQAVIVLARSSAPEITEKARKLGVKNVIKFSELAQSGH